MPITLVNAADSVSAVRALQELAAGRPVGVPTETVYGLLADVRHADNVAYLRSSGPAPVVGPLAVHLGSAYPLADLVGPSCPLFRRLTRKAWPGPLTIILEQPAEKFGPAFHALPPALRQELTEPRPDGFLALQLRCPQNSWTGALLDSAARQSLGPLVAIGLAQGHSLAVEAAEAGHDIARRNDGWAGPERCTLVVDGGRTRYARPSSVIRVRADRWSLIRAGVWDERTIRRLARLSLLFVCTGNTCRSPMAAALARRALARKLDAAPDELEACGLDVNSAGVSAWEGQPASPSALRTLRRRGLDLSAHRSRRLSSDLVQTSDLILVMTPDQRDDVIATFPSVSDKVRLLGDKPIRDPAGGDDEEYDAIARELETLVARLIEGLDL